MSRARRILVCLLAASGAAAALVAPAQTVSAAGPVTQIIVWGDSMTQVWPRYLAELAGVPVVQMGQGNENVQQTQTRFDSWYQAASPSERVSTGHLCWCGHVNTNRQTNTPDSVVPTLQEMAARVPAGLFMPIGLTNGPDSPAGSDHYQLVVRDTPPLGVKAVNQKMATAFGTAYAEVRRFLVTSGLTVAGITPTIEDQQNIEDDIPPRSLRTDKGGNPSHLNDAGRQVTAFRLNDLIRDDGWIATKAASQTSAISSANPSTYGSAIQVTVAVRSDSAQPETPTGSVQFEVNGNSVGPPMALNSGVAVTPPVRILRVGSHIITANYSGDATFEPSTDTFTQVVNP